jgi:hypothetical protein
MIARQSIAMRDRVANGSSIAVTIARAGRSGLGIAGALAAGRRALRKSIREHALLASAVTVYVTVGTIIPLILGQPLAFVVTGGEVAKVLWMIGLWVLIFSLVIEIVIVARSNPGGRVLRRLWRRISTHYLQGDRLWGGLITLALFTIIAHNFAYMQALLPILHKIDWDPSLAAWDRWLHFGRHPWEWLQPLLGHPIVTSFLSSAYAVWFFMLYGITIWQAFSRRNPVLRMQFLVTSFLIWAVLGNVAGTLLASGGPIYYGRLTGLSDPYAPLLDYLRAAAKVWPNYALDIQEILWRSYLTNGQDGRLTACVSAMPSLHVATACSFFLLGRATNRWLGLGFGLFMLVILLGSVHLAWHYAIDGYAGILGAIGLWWLCGRFLRWRPIQRLLWGEPA